jgi:hypothetical protein
MDLGWIWIYLDGFGWKWMDLDGFGWILNEFCRTISCSLIQSSVLFVFRWGCSWYDGGRYSKKDKLACLCLSKCIAYQCWAESAQVASGQCLSSPLPQVISHFVCSCVFVKFGECFRTQGFNPYLGWSISYCELSCWSLILHAPPGAQAALVGRVTWRRKSKTFGAQDAVLTRPFRSLSWEKMGQDPTRKY